MKFLFDQMSEGKRESIGVLFGCGIIIIDFFVLINDESSYLSSTPQKIVLKLTLTGRERSGEQMPRLKPSWSY